MNSTAFNRIQWIDQYKGFLIFLVVLGHCIQNIHIPMTPIAGVMYYSIYSFHMPAFFFISGYLLNYEKLNSADYVKKKAHILLAPYFAYAIFVVGYKLIGNIEMVVTTESITKSLLMMNGSIIQNLWFFPAMFVSYLCIYSFRRYSSLKSNLTLAVFLFLVAHILSAYRIKLPLFAEVGCLGAFYMLCGRMAKSVQSKLIPFTIPICITSLVFLAYSFVYQRHLVAFYDLDLGNIIVYFINSLLCPISLVLLFNKYKSLSIKRLNWGLH